MAAKTGISYGTAMWSLVTGCSHVSDGCRFCYAERLSTKYMWTKLPWTAQNAEANVHLHHEKLMEPVSWKRPQRVLVNFMGDLFHHLVPDSFLHQVFQVMEYTPRHTYLLLTKRHDRMSAWPRWPDNAWAGVSVENQWELARLEPLRVCPARNHWISFEPLLEDLGEVDLTGVGWMVVGGESGPQHRTMDHSWARHLRDQAVKARIPFYFKQSSHEFPEMGTELIEGNGTKREWREYPSQPALPVQQTLF
jgi:protein gp37